MQRKARIDAPGALHNIIVRGIEDGQRPELTGGGLVRSSGGWSVIKALRRATVHLKSDERIAREMEYTLINNHL